MPLHAASVSDSIDGQCFSLVATDDKKSAVQVFRKY